ETLQLGLLEIGFRDVRGDRLASEVAKLFVAQIRAGATNDPRRITELSGALALIEGRQQFPFRQVARRTKNNEIKWFYRYDLARHAILPFNICPAFRLIDLKMPVPDADLLSRTIPLFAE